MDGERSVPRFGAKAAGILLLIVLVVLVLEGAVLNSLLDYLRTANFRSFLQNASEQELSATRRIVNGLVYAPLFMFITFSILRRYFPNESIEQIATRFGLHTRAPLRIAVPAFLIGIGYILFFNKVLATLFPPGEFATPNPVNIVSQAVIWAQLLFVINSVTLVPVAEEFFFRGVLYTGFSISSGKAIAAITTSLIFISFHPEWLRSGYWVTHLSLFVVPFVLVIAREITGSLTSSILIHAGFNFAEGFIP